MATLRELVVRLRASLGWRREEAEMEEEFRFHVDMETERNLARGMPPDEARRAALAAFGGRERYKEEARDTARARWLEDAVRDVRYGARMLWRTPVFTLVAALSLALGIGANAAVFSVVHAVLLRPLPYPEPEQLVTVRIREEGHEHAGALAVADLRALEAQAQSFAAVGGWFRMGGGVTLTGLNGAEHLPSTRVTAGLLPALGVQPALGRLPLATEGAPGDARVVVVSHGFWRDRLGASPAALGRTLTVDGEPHTIIGVMPAGFTLPGLPEDLLWPVMQLEPPSARTPYWLRVVARLAPGATPESASAELGTLAARVKAQYPDSPGGWSYVVDSLRTTLVRDTRTTVLVLYAAVVLLLLMAAANVANLFLARASARAPELAMRAALGAGRGRLVRQLVAEGVLVGALGGAAGAVLAAWGVQALTFAAPEYLARTAPVRLEPVVLLFTAGLAVFTGALVGLVPALQLPGGGGAGALREAGAGSTGGAQRRRMQSGLVVAEFALALTVVVAAALIVQSLVRLQQVDPGARSEGVLAVRLAIPEARYREGARIETFYDEVLRRVEAVPGVSAAALSMAVPPNRLQMSNPFTPEGFVLRAGAQAPLAEELLVSPGYFRTLGIALLRGRDFSDADRADAPPVAIINETLAHRFFPGQDPVGRWVQTGDPDPDAERLQVVGVVGDVKYQGLEAAPEPTVYVPFRQNLWWRNMYLVLRTQGSPRAQLPAVRAAVAGVDSDIPLQEVRTLEELMVETVAAPRYRAGLLGGFAVLALALAGAGIYGVMAYSVSQRRRETGVRLALGASRADVVRMVLGDGMRLAAAGIALGLVAALLTSRLLGSVLFGVSPFEPLTFGLTALFLAGVGLAACALPALRASRTDPMVSLRAG